MICLRCGFDETIKADSGGDVSVKENRKRRDKRWTRKRLTTRERVKDKLKDRVGNGGERKVGKNSRLNI